MSSEHPVGHRPTSYERWGKRAFDVIGAAVAGVLTLPLQLVVALVVRRELGPPVLFRQKRGGRDGRVFELVKFRTMTDRRGADGRLLPDEQRLPPVGRFLRSTSLDELPELLNVLRGQMSLVGPRPLHARYLARYSPQQARRHEVRPGITGWSQVRGRNAGRWEDRLDDDVWYVDNLSLWLDARILLRTVATVLRRDGVSAAGHATAPEFHGCDPGVGAEEPGRS